LELRAAGTPVLFSYEEALGFCVGDVVCDKDGVAASAVFAEMANYLRTHKQVTVYHHLQQLFSHYGNFVSYNNYIICRDPKKTDQIFQRIRTAGANNSYIMTAAGASVVSVKDVTVGYDSTNVEGNYACSMPLTPDSHMLMFEFNNGVSATFRTSGTEPKIKFYTEIAGQPGQEAGMLGSILKAFVDQLVEEFLQPTLHGLV
jgi:phosphomannomutase